MTAKLPVSNGTRHVGYLEALLSAEIEDRERRVVERRLRYRWEAATQTLLASIGFNMRRWVALAT